MTTTKAKRAIMKQEIEDLIWRAGKRLAKESLKLAYRWEKEGVTLNEYEREFIRQARAWAAGLVVVKRAKASDFYEEPKKKKKGKKLPQ